MKTKFKSNSSFIRFIKNSLIFFIGTILSKFLSFFLLPLYSRVIPTSDMGKFDVSITIMTMVASICFFEIWSGLLRMAYEKETIDDKIESIAGGLQIFILSSILFTILCISLCFIIGYKYKFFILLYMLTYMLSNFLSFSARGLKYNKTFAFSGFINSVLMVGSNLFLLLKVNLDYSALYISASIGFLGQSLFLFFSCKLYKTIPHMFKWKSANFSLIKFCLPLALNTIAFWCLTSLNRVVFNAIYGDSASGLFALGARFSTLVTLITTAFNYAWQDLSFSKNSKGTNPSSLYSKGSNLYMYFLFTGFIIILPALFFIAPLFVTGDYSGAISLLPLFILSSVISAFSSFLGTTFYAIKDTKSVLITTLLGTATNILLSYPVIKLLGPDGVNIATSIAFLVIIIVRIIILKRKIGFTINYKVVSFFVIAVLISCLSFKYADWKINGLLLIGGLIFFGYFIHKFLTNKKVL